MTIANIRLKLKDFIEHGDERLVKLMYAVAKEYKATADEATFSDEDLAVFEQRRSKRLKGESKVYTWDEAKAIITRKKSA